MDKGTVFTTSVDNQSYQFVTNQSHTIQPNGVFQFNNINVYEGTLVTFKYTVDTNDVDQKFIIPLFANADTSTLKVTVQNSASDTTTETYSLVTGYSDLLSTSKVYFLQEGEDNRFEVYFGDGILGKKPVDGNIIILEYIVTNKTELMVQVLLLYLATLMVFQMLQLQLHQTQQRRRTTNKRIY